MIDLEHCTILGSESVDANSINRCLFNLYNKIGESSSRFLEASSDNLPESPFFSGGYHNALTDIDYIRELDLHPASKGVDGIVPRLYAGELNIGGSQEKESFSTESVSGTYYYNSEQLSTFCPTVESLYNDATPLIFKSMLDDDETHMSTGVSSLGIASSPIIKFTSYLTCSNAGVSFGTVTFKRNNGDQQDNIITLNLIRDLIGIDGIERVNFFTIGNGTASGVKTISENLDMISDVNPCNVTYVSDNDVIISNITKNDNSDSIRIDKDTGRILGKDESSIYGDYIELPNDEVVLNFFIMFTIKEDAIKYTDDLWCFYLVNDFEYAKRRLSNANGWASNYFKYDFRNFEAADDGHNRPDGSHEVDPEGCTVMANDAFNGCYNATFDSLCWFSPALRYADRMFNGCTHASFSNIPEHFVYDRLRSAVSMFENCTTAKFANISEIRLPRSSRLGMMFANCDSATFDSLTSINVAGDASKMFYGDYKSDFISLTGISGSGIRFISMFEGCSNAEFPELTKIESSDTSDVVEAKRMFYGLEKPSFSKIETISLALTENGYDGTSMFEGCVNASFEIITSFGNLVDGTRMFKDIDPYFINLLSETHENIATFANVHSFGNSFLYGASMFENDYYLSMVINGNSSVRNGSSMFKNTSSVIFNGDLNELIVADQMFSNTVSAIVRGDIQNLKDANRMFSNAHLAEIDGRMNSLVDADSMFYLSDIVKMRELPESTENMLASFSNISGSCEISSWGGASNERYCNQTFSNSNNISITGDILKGKIVSTAYMFENASMSSDQDHFIKIFNPEMESETDSSNRYYSTEAGENFAYVQNYDSDGNEIDGSFTFIGDADVESLSSYITSSYVANSLAAFVKIKNRSLSYDLYSVGGYDGAEGESIRLIAESIDFDTNTNAQSGNYFYSTVVGKNDESKTYSQSIRCSVSTMTEDGETCEVSSFSIYNTEPDYDDLRMFSVSSYENGDYAFVANGKTGMVKKLVGTIQIFVGNEQIPEQSITTQGDVKIEFDFAQRMKSKHPEENANITYFVIGITDKYGDRGDVNRYYVRENIDIGGKYTTAMNADEYENRIIANSDNRIKAIVIPVSRYQDASNIYGYLMRYTDGITTTNKLAFSKIESGELLRMTRNPRDFFGNEFTVNQIFEGKSASEPASSIIQTSFSIGTAEMGETWKYANCMFHNVVQDSLLSSYACFIDVSLIDTSYMFALDSYCDGDQTFKNTGYIFQNMSKSKIQDMSGMFLNRYICDSTVFKDLYNEGDYISFLIPETLTEGSSAFQNCSIETDKYSEIGLYIPPTLTGAAHMFDGYRGPKIRFGYGSNGHVEFADGMNCTSMFNGCEFENGESEKFALSIPNIYLQVFEGSDFSFNNISSLEVRNGMNFSNAYSAEEFFYNDSKLLGCENMIFDSLKTDVLDWFVSNTNDVEGVYLATVIGPKNYMSEDGKYIDYRVMSADRKSGDWRTYMSSVKQFSTLDNSASQGVMYEQLIEKTNGLRMNELELLENERGRMTCMFNPRLMFDHSRENLGDHIYEVMGDYDWESSYAETKSSMSASYNKLTFSDVREINALEMPFAFCGLSSASFDSLWFIGDSTVAGYGAFMGCSNALFNSLSGIRFIQNANERTFTSRFADDNHIGIWYGNYGNMFSNCSNAEFENLNSVMMNSKYETLSNGDRVLVWYDFDSNINYMTYSSFDSRFSLTFNVSEDRTIHIGVGDKNRNDFFDYDTMIFSSSVASAELLCYKDTLEDNILARILLKQSDGTVIHEFNVDTLGYMNQSIEDIEAKYHFIGETYSDYGAQYTIDELVDTKYLLVYHNANGYHIITVDESFERNNNHRIVFTPTASSTYEIDIYNNNNLDVEERVESFQTGIQVDESCQFIVEMSEVNGTFTPIITIIDRSNTEHFYEILADSTIEQLIEHPQRGVATFLGLSSTYPFSEDGHTILTSYSDNYGQNYKLMTTTESSGDLEHYAIVLKDVYDDSVAILSTPIPTSVPMEDAYFSIGSYNSNNTDCVVVAVYSNISADAIVYYKIYKDVYDVDRGESYKYVEETTYKPGAMDYRLVESIELNSLKSISHKAYCSGMFSNNGHAKFGNLDTICIPMSGSCAGMFAENDEMTLTSIKYCVLPVSVDAETKSGYRCYKDMFRGVGMEQLDFSNLKVENTNIYKLGYGGSATIAKELFCGVIGENGVPFDDTFNCFGKEDARKIGLDSRIISRMDFNDGTTKIVVNVDSSSGRKFIMALQLDSNTTVKISWGDGENEEIDWLSDMELKTVTHTYSANGTYQIRISNDIRRILVGDYGDDYDEDSIRSKKDTIEERFVISVDSYGEKITNLESAFDGCMNLRSICAWNDGVTNVKYCYYNCENVEGNVVAWGSKVSECDYCYYNCHKLADAFSKSMYELMPSQITSFENCVLNSSANVRKLFLSAWGGTNEMVNANIISLNLNESNQIVYFRTQGLSNGDRPFIDWGDGTTTYVSTDYSSYSHSYENIGLVMVALSNVSRFCIGDPLVKDDVTRNLVQGDVKLVSGLVWVEEGMFKGLGIEKVTIPDTVKSLGLSAFYGCENLKEVNFSDSVESVGSYCFAECSSLTNVKMSDSVNTVGNGCFSNCDSLVSVKLPYEITQIPDYFFNECSTLETIDFAEGITDIGNYCFFNCQSLTGISHFNTMSGYGDYAFAGCTGIESFEITDSIRRIGIGLFSGCKELKQVSITDNIVLKAETFDGCESLSSAHIPSTMTEVPFACFRNCENLTEVELPDGITELAPNCFNGCSKLSEIELPDGVRILNTYCFNNCKSLEKIEIPSSVEKMLFASFSGCSKLSEMTVHGMKAPTVIWSTFGDNKSNYTGYSTAASGTNKLFIHEGAEGYDEVGTAWTDVLTNESASNFKVRYIE